MLLHQLLHINSIYDIDPFFMLETNISRKFVQVSGYGQWTEPNLHALAYYYQNGRRPPPLKAQINTTIILSN